ncbi:hypothetical protein A2410_02915 [Candidatus Shapirobacteria bacterium RIFOXYC1_FULL_38_24]|uniref:Phosphoesterase PA-phosphatase related protein n=3 Tax=Patescibacteria group TaxID=1783273 RepID=A0A0G0MXA6_9BACT|nr:MAG: Phosphoesterase PA-phosphatase related protein [Candidatus Shapirobacteria bacterium GW2011_GWE2_38_30]OGJ06248.1 MAG: hypothetical protein A2192_00560 [Candidatus Nomurabacteria bacterium RIFOXYA1_FULL_35_17]OGL56159.1 MAG: hypothetical protein A2410_02915 [Candidatus Shapirobacteria bacterium RIFOXYC1_FULL_38_24]HAP37648.1 hypothetical protein [Candidatus Shapirobacteria bacterium]HCU55530.1 hypothetical protein [Candidatus Shapirobacteria bacterium]
MKLFKKIFFWQSKFDLLSYLQSRKYGDLLIVILNYSIWLFLAIVSFILVKHDANIFWQLFAATLVCEILERYLKSKKFWSRPIFQKRQHLPPGLVERWYKTGSFPSGHTMKAVFFLFFILQYQVFSPVIYLLITIPLLSFRVFAGFHYPIDMIGGFFLGLSIWLTTYRLQFPSFLVNFIRTIFNIF